MNAHPSAKRKDVGLPIRGFHPKPRRDTEFARAALAVAVTGLTCQVICLLFMPGFAGPGVGFATWYWLLTTYWSLLAIPLGLVLGLIGRRRWPGIAAILLTVANIAVIDYSFRFIGFHCIGVPAVFAGRLLYLWHKIPSVGTRLAVTAVDLAREGVRREAPIAVHFICAV
jgi:hypothetical protein